MLPTTTDNLKDESSKYSGGESPYSAMNILWQLSIRTRVSRHMLPAFKIIIILGASVTALLYYLSLDWTVFVEDQSYGIAANQGHQVRYMIESLPCSDVEKDCYTVYDAVDMFTGVVNRFLITRDVPKKYEAVVRLIPPTGIKSKESDSRFWKVNHTHISRQYVAVMLTVPFGVAALALSNSANLAANVLIVGLGGGSMNMFLTNHFPKMAITVVEPDQVVVDLAWRWFELEKKHEKIQIITMDGMKFIEEAVVKKMLFDVVIIDVCDESIYITCPAKSFIRPDFIKNLKEILEPTGSVVLNILPREDFLDQANEVVHAYQKQFPTCAIAPLLREMNTILVCQIVQQVDRHTSQRLMSERFQEAWSYFGFIQQFGVMDLYFTNGKAKVANSS
uniref:PABS domain-containing protein n=1 Tax=Elaeophora elaphi TaxID=1147741 RepID=A0A0R3RZW2_9BILA